MESVYYIVTIRVNETSWAHVWRLRSCYLGTGYDMLDLASLADRFTKDEVHNVITALLPDKVPGPDGFTNWFL
jgi:hypothetical protein